MILSAHWGYDTLSACWEYQHHALRGWYSQCKLRHTLRVWYSQCTLKVILSAHAESMIQICMLFDHVIMLTLVATRKKTIGNCQCTYTYTDNCWFTTLVNSASKVLPIGLPPKMVKFCHTSNRFLVGRGCCYALLPLYFNSFAFGWLLVSRQSTIRVAGL
jgi:hypothetical protein